MNISGTEPSSVILNQTKKFKVAAEDAPGKDSLAPPLHKKMQLSPAFVDIKPKKETFLLVISSLFHSTNAEEPSFQEWLAPPLHKKMQLSPAPANIKTK